MLYQLSYARTAENRSYANVHVKPFVYAPASDDAFIWKRLPWQEDLQIIDDTMKAISGFTDPEKLVDHTETESGS